jgi:hypothetical protein
MSEFENQIDQHMERSAFQENGYEEIHAATDFQNKREVKFASKE